MYYTMPDIRILKRLLREEIEMKLQDILKSNEGMWHRDILNTMFWDVKDELNTITDYEKLGEFVEKYYRMNLQDWINSLP